MDKRRLATIDDIEYFMARLKTSDLFDKLQDKTQVFNKRTNDAVKTRGSHSIDVGEIAAALASGLTGDEAEIQKSRLLGLLHDVGHIPFGHAGESIADAIIKARHSADAEAYGSPKLTDKEKKDIEKIRILLFGKSYAAQNTKPCFEHNENSVLQYIMLCNKLGFEVDKEIVEGILSHSTSRYSDLPPTLVQQAVRLADKVAYINYDAEDLRLSFEGKIEWNALKKIYARPILDADEKQIAIEHNGKKYYTVLEFLQGFSTGERIALFIEEAIRMAKEDRAKSTDPKYENFKTILTGGNDLIVELSNLKKEKKYYDKVTKTWTPEGEVEKKRIKAELLAKSPILYLAYEMKERSDEFIRAGTGLPNERKEEYAFQAKSSVGNEDLKNQYIYNKLVMLIEKRSQIDLSKLPEEARTIFENFYREYDEYKIKQESVIANLEGNTEGLQYPEIYTILNFIGSHSNTELLELANDLGLNEMFEKEVLPKIAAIISNEAYYDKENKKFTEEGIKERDKIVAQYGAFIKFRYGIDEFDFTPTTPKNVEEAARENGMRHEDEIEALNKSKEVSANKEQTQKQVEAFATQEKRTDQIIVDALSSQITKKENLEEEKGTGRGR